MWRTVFYVLGGALALLVLAAVVLVMLVEPDDYRDRIAAQASSALGREVRLDGPLSLRLWPRIALDIRSLSVANPAGFADAPALAEVGQASVSVGVWPLLRGELDIGQLELRDATVTLVTAPDGSSNLAGLLAEAEPDPASQPAPDLEGISLAGLTLENVALQVLDLDTDEAFNARIDELTLGPFQPAVLAPLSVRASLLDQHQEKQLVFSLHGGLRVARDAGRIDLEDARSEFELAAGGLNGQASGSGSVDLGADVATLELRDFAAGMNLDQRSAKLEASETLNISLGDPVSAKIGGLELAIDGQPLAVAGEFSLGDPPTAELTVAGEALDLRPWLSAPEQAGAAEKSSPAAASDDSALIGPRLNFTLALDRLTLSDDLILRRVEAQARLVDGVLTLEPVDAQALSGRFSGRVAVDFNAAPPALEVSPRLTGIDVQQLVRLFSPTAPVRGLGEMDLDLRFQGLSAGEILASLDGEGRFSLNEGALLGVDLKRLVDEEITTSRLARVQQAFGGETPFQNLSGRIQAEAGVLSLPDLRLDAEDFDLTGGGRMDLAAGDIAYQLELRLGPALSQRLPRALARASDGVIPLTIAGPISRPTVRVDLATIAEGALQRELQDRLFDRLRPEGEPEQEPQAERPEGSGDQPLRALGERRERNQPPPEERPRA
ncbi:MAG: AsmA family protein [Wenzhouxiangella sp.]